MTDATFSDLPIHVLERIVKKTSFTDRMLLRNICIGFRNVVDSTESYCEELIFDFCHRTSRVQYQNRVRYYNKKGEKFLPNGRIVKKLVEDAATFMKNPKLKIGKIKLFVERIQMLDEFLEVLKLLKYQLDVQSIDMMEFDNRVILSLRFLESENLGEIECNVVNLDEWKWDFNAWRANELNVFMETEPWKRARTLSCGRFPRRFQLEKWLHFKEIRITDFGFYKENLIMVKDILLKSTHLESFILQTSDFRGDFKKEVNTEINKIMSADPAYNRRSRQFSIPNSRDYFQLKFELDESFALKFTKVSRN